jgi:hypothetical protein
MYAKTKSHHRQSQAAKDANNQQWYKDRIDEILARAFTRAIAHRSGAISDTKRMQVNYDLFNNILNTKDLEYVCAPYGAEAGQMPATMANRDIISPKIKVLLGMEIKRPFAWRVVAVNEEATTRKEQEKAKRIRDFVVGGIMAPIRAEIEQKYQEQSQGKELTPEQQQQIQQQIEQEAQAQTPEEVAKYMAREHQDPAEIMMNQILEYGIKEQHIMDKFNQGWKHAQISGYLFYRAYISNKRPRFDVVNPMDFDYDRGEKLFVEDGEWATQRKWYTLSEVVAEFGPDLTDQDIDDLYERYPFGTGYAMEDFTFFAENDNRHRSDYSVPVYHVEFKSLCKIGFLDYLDQNTGSVESTIVMEGYQFNEEAGDIHIEWQYIPQRHEGYRISNDKYVRMGPVQGQFTDMDKLDVCKLSYYGCALEDTNSQVVSSVDRIKTYQYYTDIVAYRLEMLVASDKGKKILINVNALPKNIPLEKWMYYLDATSVVFFDPTQEGARGTPDAGSVGKELDMSLVSQINRYVELLEYLDNKAGACLGVPKQMEGQIAPNEAVTNTKQTVVQSSYILEPMFELHNIVKGNALTGYMNCCRSAYTANPPRALSFVLDDMSIAMLTIDTEMLDASTYGLYLANSAKAAEVKLLVEQLAHAAMQNNAIAMADVIKIVANDNVQEAVEQLEVAEKKKTKEVQANAQQVEQMKSEEAEKVRSFTRETWGEQRAQITLKEEERRKTELQKQAILSVGFNPDKDTDQDTELDVMEVYKEGTKARIAREKTDVEKDKLAHQIKDDAEKNKIAKDQVEVDRIKAQNSKKPAPKK